MGDKGIVKALALATQFGFAVAVPMLVFIGGGAWLDSRFGTRPWLFFLGLALGIISAGAALYQVAMLPSRKRAEPGAKEAPDKIERSSGDSETPDKHIKPHAPGGYHDE